MNPRAKTICVILLLLPTVGFALCGAVGLMVGLTGGFNPGPSAVIVGLGVAGFAAAIGFGVLIRLVIKSPPPNAGS